MDPPNKKTILLASFVGVSVPLFLGGCIGPFQDGGTAEADGTQNNEGAQTSVTVTAKGEPRMNVRYQLSEDKSKVYFSATRLSDKDQGCWLGVGLSKNGKMAKSDVVVCHGDKVLTRYWVTGYGLGAGTPIDGLCDVKAGTMTWTMNVQAENDKQRSIILSDDEPSINTLIWAIGTGKNLGYHKHRGDFDVDITGAKSDLR